MLGLLESKLGSLPPEITNLYPELIRISLNDINPEIVKITQIHNSNNEKLQAISNNISNEKQNNNNPVQENKISNINKNTYSKNIEINFFIFLKFLFLYS
jgi:hypothetical protein